MWPIEQVYIRVGTALVSTKESILADARDGGAGRECKRVKWATPFAQHSDKRLIITPAAEL